MLHTFIRVPALRCAGLLAGFLLLGNAHAGEQWEIVSSTQAPDGRQIPLTQTKCVPADTMNPSTLLEGLGSCTFDQKNTSGASMTFSMHCKTPGMPADLDSMKIAGDATLGAGAFDMRYVITAGAGFRMEGTAKARKLGMCTEQ